jgi:hypothetical protein
MNSIALFKVAAALIGAAIAMPAGDATAERVMSGALDMCQAIDNGTTVVRGGVEACCAQEVTEFDNGHIEFGDRYCVACVQGTDNCEYYPNAWRTPPLQEVRKTLTTRTKQAPLTGN